MSRASERRSPSFNYRFMSVSQGETTASPSGLLSAFHPFLRTKRSVGRGRNRNRIVFQPSSLIAIDHVTCALLPRRAFIKV